MANRVIWERLFLLWVATGILGVATAAFSGYRCSFLHHPERTFRHVGPDHEKQSQNDDYDQWLSRLLAVGALCSSLRRVPWSFADGLGWK